MCVTFHVGFSRLAENGGWLTGVGATRPAGRAAWPSCRQKPARGLDELIDNVVWKKTYVLHYSHVEFARCYPTETWRAHLIGSACVTWFKVEL